MAENRRCPRIEISFASRWWFEEYGMDFGERFWADPFARAERSRDQQALLYERFGDVGLGSSDPRPLPSIEAYGHRFMSVVWGCEIVYQPDQAPSAVVLPDAWVAMADLTVPDIDSLPAVRRAFREAVVLTEKYGFCEGAINYGGPLNNAVSVFGEDILAACIAEPDLAVKVLRIMAETMMAVIDRVSCPISGIEASTGRESGGIGNCPVCMISPETYAQVVFPADRWLRGQFKRFFLHHCGIFHPYADAYKPLNPDLLDVGGGTDLRITRTAYPSTEMSLEITASSLVGKSRAEIDTMVAGMVSDAGPVDLISYLWVAEAGTELGDDTVRDLVTSPERVSLSI